MFSLRANFPMIQPSKHLKRLLYSYFLVINSCIFASFLEEKLKRLDVGILIDSSSSVSPLEFARLRSFTINLIKQFTIRYTNVYFGIIVYNDNPSLVLTMENTHLLNISLIVNSIMYKTGGHRTDLALLAATDKLFCGQRFNQRPVSKKVMIVITAKDTDVGSSPYNVVQEEVQVSYVCLWIPSNPAETNKQSETTVVFSLDMNVIFAVVKQLKQLQRKKI